MERVRTSVRKAIQTGRGADEEASVILTDQLGLGRIFLVPAGWTGDLSSDGVGLRTLDLCPSIPHEGFDLPATTVEDPSFDPEHVVSIAVELGSSRAIDDLAWRLPPLECPDRRVECMAQVLGRPELLFNFRRSTES